MFQHYALSSYAITCAFLNRRHACRLHWQKPMSRAAPWCGAERRGQGLRRGSSRLARPELCDSEQGEVLLRGVGTLRYDFPPKASVQWQPGDLTIHTKKWFLGAGFLGASPISLNDGCTSSVVACACARAVLRGRPGEGLVLFASADFAHGGLYPHDDQLYDF